MKTVILLFMLIFHVMDSQQRIIDTRQKNKEPCPICQNMAKERCHTNGKTDPLCHKIAHESCPTKLLAPKVHELPEFSVETEEFLEVTASRKQKEERKGVLDLVSGILSAVHTSTKADLRRAKEKALKEEIFKKVASF